MKKLSLIALLFLALCSCQKELSFEPGASPVQLPPFQLTPIETATIKAKGVWKLYEYEDDLIKTTSPNNPCITHDTLILRSDSTGDLSASTCSANNLRLSNFKWKFIAPTVAVIFVDTLDVITLNESTFKFSARSRQPGGDYKIFKYTYKR